VLESKSGGCEEDKSEQRACISGKHKCMSIIQRFFWMQAQVSIVAEFGVGQSTHFWPVGPFNCCITHQALISLLPHHLEDRESAHGRERLVKEEEAQGKENGVETDPETLPGDADIDVDAATGRKIDVADE
jgi:hypothetical protein